VSLTRSWQFIGGLNSPWYRMYDGLRRRLNKRLVDFLAARITSPMVKQSDQGRVPPRVLEAGSGTAFALSLFRRRPHVGLCVALDIDETALREARKQDLSLSAVVADLRRMPFARESFSLVFNSSTIEHLDDPAAAVEEMQRTCRMDGCVFVGVPYRYGPLAFQPLIDGTTVGRWLGPVFSRKSLTALLRGCGLTPVTWMRYFLNFFVGAVAIKTEACGQETP